MISSNSINYSKYSIINEKNINLSTDIEISEQNKQEKIIEKKIEKSDINTSEIENENEKDNDKLLSLSEKENTFSKEGLLYGNKIENVKPIFIGKCLAFWYNSEGNPKITIGPDCKTIFFNNIYNIYYYL
jgi:hypothetical protein